MNANQPAFTLAVGQQAAGTWLNKPQFANAHPRMNRFQYRNEEGEMRNTIIFSTNVQNQNAINQQFPISKDLIESEHKAPSRNFIQNLALQDQDEAILAYNEPTTQYLEIRSQTARISAAGLENRASHLLGAIRSSSHYLVNWILSTLAHGVTPPLSYPLQGGAGNHYIHVGLIGLMLNPGPNIHAIPNQTSPARTFTLDPITLQPPNPNINFANHLAQNNVLRGFLTQQINALAERFADGGQNGQEGYHSLFLVQYVKVVFITAHPLDLHDFPVACNLKGNASRGVYTFDCHGYLLHCLNPATTHNNCLMFALRYHHFKRMHQGKSRRNMFNQYLLQEKLRFLREELEIPHPDEDHVFNLQDRELVFRLAHFFKIHLVIFTEHLHLGEEPSELNQRKRLATKKLELFLDTRTLTYNNAPERQAIQAWGSKRRAMEMDQVREHTSFFAGKHSKHLPHNHVYPIMNDSSSIFCQYMSFCDGCRTTFQIDPITGRGNHTCNRKTMEFVKNNLWQFQEGVFHSLLDREAMEGKLLVEPNGTQHNITLFNPQKYQPQTGTKLFKSCPYGKQDNLLFFDLETLFLPEEAEQAKVYAVGYYQYWDRTYNAFFGRQAMDQFISYLSQLDRGVILIAYNGARFDFVILVRELIIRQTPLYVNQFMINKSELLSFTIHHRERPKVQHKIWDLYKFTLSSLSAACKSAGVPLQKSTFPHDFITSWDSLDYQGPLPEEHLFPPNSGEILAEWRRNHPDNHYNLREESLTYLRIDVLAMAQLFEKQQATMLEILKDLNLSEFHLTAFISASQISNQLGLYYYQRNKITLYPPSDIYADMLYRSGYTGGPVSYMKRHFRSAQFERVSKLLEEGRGREAYEAVDDYLIYLDVTSLYPTVMIQFYYPFGMPFFLLPQVLAEFNQHLAAGRPQVLFEPWEPYMRIDLIHGSNRPQDYFFPADVFRLPPMERLVCSYWDVTFTPPQDTRFPYHMTKTNSGKIHSFLYPRQRQWFYSPDIYAMYRRGYTIHEVHNIITWNSFGRIIRDNMNAGKELKERGTREKNNVLRSFGKVFVNSYYGKQGQIPNDKEFEIIHSLRDLGKFVSKNVVQDSTLFTKEDGSNVWMLKGVTRARALPTNKLPYIAAMVTAYSRMYMSEHIFRPILEGEPDPEKAQIYYTDTDSAMIHKDCLRHLHPDLIVDPTGKRPELFGQLKDDIAKESKHYETLKTSEPIKPLELIVLAKKVYYLTFLLPDGTVEATQACKGITDDIEENYFQEALLDPHKGKKEVYVPFQVEKNFFSTQTMKRTGDLYLDSMERKRARLTLDETVSEEEKVRLLGNLRVEAEQIHQVQGMDPEQNAGFLLRRSRGAHRTFNQNPTDFRLIDPLTQKAYPWGHPGITPEMRQRYRELYKLEEPKDRPVRFAYKELPEINLTPDFIEELTYLSTKKDQDDVLRENGTLHLIQYDLFEEEGEMDSNWGIQFQDMN